MDFINDINCETLIIGDSYLKNKIFRLKKLLPIKFMTIDEFFSKYFFTYQEDAILYLINNYYMKYDVAKDYLNQLYYIDDKIYNIYKLDFLGKLKKELIEHNLLIFHDDFRLYLDRVKILLYDPIIDSFTLNAFKNFNYQIIDRKSFNYSHNVYEFNSIEEEVHFIAHNISELIANGINISKIKLTNVGSEYYNVIERVFALYNLKVNINYQTSLANFPLVKDFINYYQDCDLDIALSKVENDSNIYYELLNVINKYIKYQHKDLLIYKIKNSYINSDKYTNSIEIIDYLNYDAYDDEYIFMLSFNDGVIPKYEMDSKYITDDIAPVLGLNTSKELNTIIYDRTLKAISNIKNLIITYKLRDFKNSYYPSVLCQNFNVVKVNTIHDVTYSENYDKLLLAKCYDEYYKYGVNSDEFNILRNNYQINYNSYSNKYTKINRDMDKLMLSYSKMQLYNQCAFKYYLSDILKIDIYKENFSTIIGRMVHFVLEKCLANNSYDVDAYVSEFLKDTTFANKELFFLQKYKEAIKELLDQIILEREYTLFNQALYEKKIDIDCGNDVHFTGIIDKVLYYIDNNTTYVALIDYKTGMDDISLKYLKYGLNIQLPIYLYLASKLNFNNIKYCGFYLQKFNIVNKDYRLIGYSNADLNTLRIIDSNYANSKIIKGLKLNNDGSFSKNSKILSDSEIDDIKVEVIKQIDKVINNIRDNRFEINPKIVDGKNISCEYCKFRDVCFVTKDDEILIKSTTFGGDS